MNFPFSAMFLPLLSFPAFAPLSNKRLSLSVFSSPAGVLPRPALALLCGHPLPVLLAAKSQSSVLKVCILFVLRPINFGDVCLSLSLALSLSRSLSRARALSRSLCMARCIAAAGRQSREIAIKSATWRAQNRSSPQAQHSLLLLKMNLVAFLTPPPPPSCVGGGRSDQTIDRLDRALKFFVGDRTEHFPKFADWTEGLKKTDWTEGLILILRLDLGLK